MADTLQQSSTLQDSGSENWQDANSALIDLEKGLRSSKVGDQSEAIVKFPVLFEKYPFPILVNAAFLKLADVFRVGTNFLRLCIFKVTQQSERHLEKILNKDEFLKRIYSVIHSNDPIARAITLRVLGSIACIIPERKNVHHSIHNSLDSHDQVELEAAIFATEKFCAQSRDFAAGICDKIAEMIQGLATPVEMKLKLIPIFQHMHHEVTSVAKVRQLCNSLLPSYPSRSFVEITLRSLSTLVASSLIDIPAQVKLLMLYLTKDPRNSIKVQALKDLRMLAQKAPHVWDQQHTQELCEFVQTCNYDTLQAGGLWILVCLSRTVCVCALDCEEVLQVCDVTNASENTTCATLSSELLTNIALARIKQDPSASVLCEQAATILEGSIVLCCVNSQLNPLKLCLSSVCNLVRHYPQSAAGFVESLTSLLVDAQDDIALALCKCLVTIAAQCPAVLQPLHRELSCILNQLSSDDKHANLLVGLSTLLFQAHQVYDGEKYILLHDDVKTILRPQLDKLSSSCKFWTIFRIARQAARQGFYSLACQLFGSLTTKVASEHFFFWLSSLHDFCLAESKLSEPHKTSSEWSTAIFSASSKYYEGIAAIKASVTPEHSQLFQCQFVELRAEMLQAHNQLLASCASLRSCPPPALATAVAMTTRQDVHELSHLSSQMNDCCHLFRSLAEKFGKLHSSSFDADPVTLGKIEALQQSCLLIAHCIDILISKTNQGSIISNERFLLKRNPSNRLSDACQQILQALEDFAVKVDSVPVCHLQIEFLCKASVTILQVPFTFPKLFFKSLQSTSITLALSPSPRSPGEAVSVTMQTKLALKVEGIIKHGTTAGTFRKIQSVTLVVKTSREESKQHSSHSDAKPTQDQDSQITQTVEPHNDYFSAQFLLSFSSAAMYTVHVNTSVTDETGASWNTGPHSTLLVKSTDGSKIPYHRQTSR